MEFWKVPVVIAMLPLMASCTALPKADVKDISSNKVAMVSNTAEATASVFQIGAERAHYCASNSPDATFSTSSSTGFSISLLNFGGGSPESDESSSSSSGDEMMGRTPAVLAARDIMYRACELIGNLNLTEQQSLAMYSESLKAATSILAAEVASTKITQSSNMNSNVSNSAPNLTPMGTVASGSANSNNPGTSDVDGSTVDVDSNTTSASQDCLEGQIWSTFTNECEWS
ncbi:hypothetical protein N9D73_01470 [Planktomarina temperata]|nr:hypothetical protein [Planktomarina temperata]